MIRRQLQRNHAVAVDLLNVVAEMLVANNHFNVLRDSVIETIFLDLMRHMSAGFFSSFVPEILTVLTLSDIVGYGLDDRDVLTYNRSN